MKVILTGDWHIGLAGAINVDVIYDIAGAKWANKPVLLLGDLIDCGLKKGMNFENEIHPQDQINKAREILEMLDVQGYVNGNHEHRIYSQTGINPWYDLLGKPEHEAVIDTTSFYLLHGKSHAENSFLEHSKLIGFIDANVIAMGHSHVLAKKDILQNGKRCTWLRTGSMIEKAAYADDAGLPPLIPGYAEYDTKKAIARLFRVTVDGKVSEI